VITESYNYFMNRTIANIIIDIIAAFLFLGMIATGYLLRFPLPPGSNKALSLWSYTRHQWGDIHFWISLGLLTVLVVHLALHWNWVVTVIGKRCHRVQTAHPSLIRSGILTGGIAILLMTLFAWTAENSVKEIAGPMRGKHLGHSGNADQVESLAASPVQNTIDQEGVKTWKDVYPIFENNCLSCHGPQKQLANFRVDRREGFFGSNESPPLILPGQSAISPLIAIVSGTKKDMPVANRHKLPERDVALLKAWIDSGAE
jgi:mono/diheme cytochrome c family protein